NNNNNNNNNNNGNNNNEHKTNETTRTNPVRKDTPFASRATNITRFPDVPLTQYSSLNRTSSLTTTEPNRFRHESRWKQMISPHPRSASRGNAREDDVDHKPPRKHDLTINIKSRVHPLQQHSAHCLPAIDTSSSQTNTALFTGDKTQRINIIPRSSAQRHFTQRYTDVVKRNVQQQQQPQQPQPQQNTKKIKLNSALPDPKRDNNNNNNNRVGAVTTAGDMDHSRNREVAHTGNGTDLSSSKMLKLKHTTSYTYIGRGDTPQQQQQQQQQNNEKSIPLNSTQSANKHEQSPKFLIKLNSRFQSKNKTQTHHLNETPKDQSDKNTLDLHQHSQHASMGHSNWQNNKIKHFPKS
ncbi:hypothetical protein RFI_20443, partial [Reticulomyxa filosa]